MNEELIVSAVSFLNDANVQNSPLTKKVEFLESKGLNQQEIEEALRRASNPSSSASTTTSSSASATHLTSCIAPPPAPIDYYNAAPPIPDRSWKDYFIMATTTVGVGYGLYQVVSRYLLPSIIPPSVSAIEKDKQTIDEEFTKIDKILEQLSQDQQEIKEDNEAKLKEIDIVIDNVNDFLSKYNKDKLKFDDDLRLMKLEIDNLSNSIEKNMGFTKNNIKDELAQVNEELQSLKQLIKVKQSSANVSKITPVSSIPSASEILKRAKAKREEEKESANSVAKVATPEPTPAPAATSSSESITGASTKGGITAAGIPAWQLKHKQEEEEQEKQKEKEKQAQVNDTSAGSSQAKVAETAAFTDKDSAFSVPEVAVPETVPGTIPSWQLNATDEKADEKIKETLKNIGVPAWQLNNAA